MAEFHRNFGEGHTADADRFGGADRLSVKILEYRCRRPADPGRHCGDLGGAVLVPFFTFLDGPAVGHPGGYAGGGLLGRYPRPAQSSLKGG